MTTLDEELKANGINVICPLKKDTISGIASYVARSLCMKFPELKLDYKILYTGIARLPMYLADMENSASGACYFYKNQSMYFRRGLSEREIQRLAVHESIHHFQEVSDFDGNLIRIGLCSYLGDKGYGNALNEAAVQTMAAYATDERADIVTYYGIMMPSDSPDYYPLQCNLLKQITYLTGASILYDSAFFANDKFFKKFKEIYGENKALKIQYNFEKLLWLEGKLAEISARVQTEELSFRKFKRCIRTQDKYRNNIAKLFFSTQNLILKIYFNRKIKEVYTVAAIEEYRKQLYNYRNLIGYNDEYTFFNDFYIEKMTELDVLYERFTGDYSLAVVKKSRISRIIDSIKRILGLGKMKDTSMEQDW